MTRLTRTLMMSLAILLGLSGVLLHPAQAQDSSAETPDASAKNELVSAAETLLRTIEKNLLELDKLREARDTAEGEDRILADRRRLRKGLETLAKVDAFVENVIDQEEQGLDASGFRTSAEELVSKIAPEARQSIKNLSSEISGLSAQRLTATGEELIRLESRIARRNEKLSTILGAALDNEQHMAALGLPSTDEEVFLAEELSERAEVSAERILFAIEQINSLQDRLGEKPGDADLQTTLIAIEAKRQSSRNDLEATIAMMDLLNLETAEHQRLLIESSGRLSADILDSDIALGLFQQWMLSLKTWAIESGPQIFFKILVFVLILFLFRLLARLTRKVVSRAVSSSKLQFSQLLQKMFISISGNVVLLVGLLVALSQLGFALGPVLAGLGIMGFVVGFALQDTLGNFAAGIMILVYRPFDVEDLIEAAGVFGKVSEMNMVSTTVLTIDHQTLVIPNGKIWGDVIKNVTAQQIRRVDMVFGVSYSDDIPQTEEILTQILEEHPKILDDPEPVVKLHNLGDSSVDFVVRPWCKTEDYWDIHWDVTREVKMRFDREGISIPFPQRDVHHYEEQRLAADAGMGADTGRSR